MSLDALFTFNVDVADVPRGLPLVAGLTGFTDSGNTVSQFTDYILDTLDSRVVGEFDHDQLLDYRARRPVIYFDQDHLTGYEPPRLALYLVKDEIGRSFLFLTGYEPDFRWQAFSDAVLELARMLDVASMTWVHAIPMPTPHTRPIGATVSGSRDDLISAHSVWRPHTQVPATAMQLVEFRMHQRGDDVVGFVLLVPHYLGDTEFPAAAIKALEVISLATGLIFPTDRLREESREFLAKIDEQKNSNEELSKLVLALEERYDKYMEENAVRLSHLDDSGPLPSADEIAAELEKFLAMKRSTEDSAGDSLFDS
jgi:hypothetical protein